MKIIAVNGSPRKNWNTARLLTAALEQAQAKGAETKLYHLYELNYKGCQSCFACKRLGSPLYGKCAMRDDLTDILNEIYEADGLIMGSPIYFGSSTGEFRSFLERLLFPVKAYDNEKPSLLKKKIVSGLIYTMGVKDESVYMTERMITQRMLTQTFFAESEIMCHTDAYQFDDYSKYHCPAFNVEEKKAHYQEFDQELAKAGELGRRIAERILEK